MFPQARVLVPTAPHKRLIQSSQVLWIYVSMPHGNYPYEHGGKESNLGWLPQLLPGTMSLPMTPIKLLFTTASSGNPIAYLGVPGSEGPLACDLLYLKKFP